MSTSREVVLRRRVMGVQSACTEHANPAARHTGSKQLRGRGRSGLARAVGAADRPMRVGSCCLTSFDPWVEDSTSISADEWTNEGGRDAVRWSLRDLAAINALDESVTLIAAGGEVATGLGNWASGKLRRAS
jgi:hypothetical protein